MPANEGEHASLLFSVHNSRMTKNVCQPVSITMAHLLTRPVITWSPKKSCSMLSLRLGKNCAGNVIGKLKILSF